MPLEYITINFLLMHTRKQNLLTLTRSIIYESAVTYVSLRFDVQFVSFFQKITNEDFNKTTVSNDSLVDPAKIFEEAIAMAQNIYPKLEIPEDEFDENLMKM